MQSRFVDELLGSGADFGSGDMPAAPPPQSPPPSAAGSSWMEPWLLVGAAVAIVLLLTTVACVLRRRSQRRQRIALLWQQHIQDNTGAYDSFLDAPAPSSAQAS